MKLESRAKIKDWKLKPDFEYTVRDTPQRNHIAEVGFATIGGRDRAMMHYANVPMEDIYMVYKEALTAETRLDGPTVVVRSGKIATRYENYMGKVTGFRSILITWGEAGLVKTRKKSTPKIGDRGVTCIFVGYNTDSGYDIYRMWNPRKRIHRTRYIICLKIMYYQVKLKKARQLGGNVIELGRTKV